MVESSGRNHTRSLGARRAEEKEGGQTSQDYREEIRLSSWEGLAILNLGARAVGNDVLELRLERRLDLSRSWAIIRSEDSRRSRRRLALCRRFERESRPASLILATVPGA
jgi:hypothetical protein